MERLGHFAPLIATSMQAYGEAESFGVETNAAPRRDIPIGRFSAESAGEL